MCDCCSQTHATVPMVHNGETIQIDIGIQELISRLWKQEIDTDNSCECSTKAYHAGFEPYPTAYISFTTRNDFYTFLLATEGQRAINRFERDLARRKHPTTLHIMLTNGWFLTWFRNGTDEAFMVNFPPDQIDTITQKLPE